MVSALATCDVAAIVEQIRVTRGWSQAELADALGYSQSWVSRVVNGQQSLTIDQVRKIAHRLTIPVHLLRFASVGNGPAPGALARPADARAAGQDKGASTTRRRDFGKVVAMATLPLPAASANSDIDETTAPTLHAITGGQRRLDASSPARELAKAALGHLELSGRTLARARGTPFASEIAAASSEAAGFAAWLHADMADSGSARTYYRVAVDRARQAGYGLLDVYMLGSLAAFEIEAEEGQAGLTLAAEAQRRLDDTDGAVHPTARAWLSCVRALGHATLGDTAAARHELAVAERSVAQHDNAEPPWPWVFAFTEAKVASYRALAAVRLRRPNDARSAFAEAFEGGPSSSKQQAVLMVELAQAHAEAGDADEAFRLATAALRIGTSLGSERVVDRVRRFRRRHRRTKAPESDTLDEMLITHVTSALAP
ncbi:hypothetical protein GCM10022402_07200 [Salinactinospora qingdaonensis]|uniref:HTH cro/C1-type domain-containing protein n=1 Tax=Salinactinospora qingdaonensis TaxID=702744 RepID=A0ABP7F2L0_9ACTN